LGTCWAIAFIRMIAAHLYIHGKVEFLLSLSAKHLFANIKEKFSTGFLKNYEGVKIFLKEEGLVEEHECKCTAGKFMNNNDACVKVKDKNVFKIREFVVIPEGSKVDETKIITLLNTHGPIAAHVRVTPECMKDNKDEIYFGPTKNDKTVEGHIILLTGYGTRDDIHYFEYQNSWGMRAGDGGFGKFARKNSLPKGDKSLIVAYMYPEVQPLYL
ncbi:unnamed protein product, partial [Arabidopsis halleri]